jgi:hypothetical protein
MRETIMNRERLIEIMSNDDGDISAMRACKCTATEGLNILSKYTDKSVLTGANHDVIFSIDIDDALEAGLTEVEAIRLREINWMLEDEDFFACFV